MTCGPKPARYSAAVLFLILTLCSGVRPASAQYQVVIGRVIVGAIVGKLTELAIDHLIDSAKADTPQRGAEYSPSIAAEQPVYVDAVRLPAVIQRSAAECAQNIVPPNFHVEGCPNTSSVARRDAVPPNWEVVRSTVRSNQNNVTPGFNVVYSQSGSNEDNVPSNWSVMR